MYLGIFTEHGRKLFDDRWGYRCSGGDDPFYGRQRYPILFSVFAHTIQKGRGGKHTGDALVQNGLNNIFWIYTGGFRGVHIRYDRRYPQGRPKKGKQRECGKIYFIPGYLQMGFYVTQLCVEVSVGVYRTFCRTCAAGGKEYGGCIVLSSLRHRIRRPGRPAQLAKGKPSPKPAPAHRYPCFECFKKSGI